MNAVKEKSNKSFVTATTWNLHKTTLYNLEI